MNPVILKASRKLALTALLLGCLYMPGAQAQQAINEGLGGSWYNPSTSGQGLFLDVMPTLGQVFLAYFTYQDDSDSEAESPGGDQFWLTAQGPYTGDTATLTAHLTRGGWLDSEHPVKTIETGAITLEFQSCTSATLTIESLGPPLNVENVTIPLTRLTPDTLCAASN